MERVDEYLGKARECRDSAAAATSARIRDQFLRMAETWEVLARQRNSYILLEATLAGLLRDADDLSS